MTSNRFFVEVAYALPERQLLVSLEVDAGVTAAQAVELSEIRGQFAQLQGAELSLGIFGRPCPHDQVLSAGDRVEIYRELQCDPKETRRRRASEH